MLSQSTRFSLAGLRRIILGVFGLHSSGMAITATNPVLGVGRPALRRFGEGRSACRVPGRSYVNFVLQGGRFATERISLSECGRPAVISKDHSWPTMLRLVNNQTRFYKVPAIIDYVDSDTAANLMGISLYELVSGTVRHLLDNIRVVKRSHSGTCIAVMVLSALLMRV